MRKKIFFQEQAEMMRRMLPFAITMFIHYISTNFCAYDTLFKQLHGISNQTIGLLNGIACVATMFAEMLFSRLSDASRSVKRIAIVGTVITSIIAILVPVSARWYVGSFCLLLVMITVRDTIMTPASTLLENWVLRSSYQERFDYGITKSVGAVGAILGSFLASAVMILLCRKMDQVKAVDAVTYLFGILFLVSAITMLPMRNAPAAAREQATKQNLNPMRLIRNKEFLALMLAYGVCCAALNPAESFLSEIMLKNGLDTARLGFIVGLQAVFQFPVLLMFSKMQARLPMRPLAALGIVLYGVTYLLRCNATVMWVLVVSTVFQGTAASMLMTAAYNYIYELVPVELRGTGQSFFIIFGSLGGAVGSAFGGQAIDLWGVQSFYFRAGVFVICVGVGYFLLTQLMKRRTAQAEG